MEIERIIMNSVNRLIEYAQENQKKKDKFNDGVGLGIYIALSCFQTDLETYSDDDEILKKTGLDIDLDKLNL